ATKRSGVRLSSAPLRKTLQVEAFYAYPGRLLARLQTADSVKEFHRIAGEVPVARSRNSFPSYLRHASGKARAVWTDALGIRHFRMLPGPHDSKESRAAFARLQLELETAPHRV